MLSAVVTCYQGPAGARADARPPHPSVLLPWRCATSSSSSTTGVPTIRIRSSRDLAVRDNHVIAIEHSRNFGSQSAFLGGMQISTGDAVALLDGDLQDPPELIAKFYASGGPATRSSTAGRESGKIVVARRSSPPVLPRVPRLSYVRMPLDAGDFR